MDIIEATWNQLPNIMPVIQKTVNDKKEFLMEQEIDSLDIVLFEYNCIRHEIRRIIKCYFFQSSIFFSDKMIFDETYSQKITRDIPVWMRKMILKTETEEAIERIVDIIMSDSSNANEFMKDYIISVDGIKNYENAKCEEKTDKEFSSYIISQHCKNIANELMELEKYIEKRPYVGVLLKIQKKNEKDVNKNLFAKMEYESKKEELDQHK